VATTTEARTRQRRPPRRRAEDSWVKPLIARLIADCHDDQRAWVTDPAERSTALVGRGGGKTTGGLARFLIRMLRQPGAKCVFIATTRESAELLIWAKLKDTCERIGLGPDKVSFSEAKLRCTFKFNGSSLRLVGADNKREIDKLRGQPFDEVGIDEGASHPNALVEALVLRIVGPRMRPGGALWIVGTPGHVLRGFFYDATRPGSPLHRPWSKRSDHPGWKGWSSHHWTLEDAAKTTPAMRAQWEEQLREKERNGWADNHPVWTREYLGIWAADDTTNIYRYRPHDELGKPFNQWDPERVGPLGFAKLPAGEWSFGIGHDMGHSDPFTIDVFAWNAVGDVLHCYCWDKTEMYPLAIAQVMLGENLNHDHLGGVLAYTGWPEEWVADGAHMADAILEELRRVYGVRMIAAEKGYKYKFPAIEVVNGMLVGGKLRILKGSALEVEMTQLQWAEDQYGKLVESKGQANHHSDGSIGVLRRIAPKLTATVVTPPPAPKVKAAAVERGEPPVDDEPSDVDEMLAPGSWDDGNDGL
jgi:hypothetical protein